MVRLSNTVLAIFNIITGLLALAAIGISFYEQGYSACLKGIQSPLIITGAALFAISLLGLIGSCCRINFILFIYLFVMVVLIVGLIVFTLFTILVTNDVAGKVASITKIVDFRHWLQNHFGIEKNWSDIKNCLIDGKICQGGGERKIADFYHKNLSPMQLGCCQPPAICGYKRENATFWLAPKTGPAVKDNDCTTWSNKQETLCYNCKACNAGFVESTRKKWRQLTIFNICITIISIMLYSIGCCAMKNNKAGKGYCYP